MSKVRSVSLITVSAFVLGCGADKSPTSPITSPPGELTKVVLGSDVSETARAHLTAVMSLTDSISTHDTQLRVLAPDPTGALVIAVNSAGQAILAAYVQPDGEMILDASSTALAAVHPLLLASVLMGADPLTLQSRIAAHPQFAGLVATIRSLSEAGQSYVSSPEALAAINTIAADLQPAPVRFERSRATSIAVSTIAQTSNKIGRLPVYAEDVSSSPNYSITNSAFISFAATSTDLATGAQFSRSVIPERSLKLLSLSPSFGNDTHTPLDGRNGAVRVTVAQDDETRDRQLRLAFEKFLTLIFKATGFTPGESFVARVSTKLLSPSVFVSLRSASSPQAASRIYLEVLAENAPTLAGELLAEQVANGAIRGAAILVLQNTLGIIKNLQAAFQFVQTLYFFRDWIDYFNADEKADVCQEQQAFVPCGTLTVSLTGSSARAGIRSEENGYGKLFCTFPFSGTVSGGDSGLWTVASGTINGVSAQFDPDAAAYFDKAYARTGEPVAGSLRVWNLHRDADGIPDFPPFLAGLTLHYRIATSGSAGLTTSTFSCQ